jgi:hypothetical protein
MLFPCRAAIDYNLISENRIVAVLGDENQFVKRDTRKINSPLSFERGHRDHIRGNDTDSPSGRIGVLWPGLNQGDRVRSAQVVAFID